MLTACCAFDVMRVPALITVTVVGGGAVHGVEVSKERTQFFNGGDVITRLHPPIIIWLCSRARERVKGGLSAHFLKSRLDVGVDEGDRIVRVLVVRGQIMEHVKCVCFYYAKALNPLYPLSTLLSHTGTMATACKIQGRFISVETEVLLA
jgi:hypothetical protein